MRHARHALGAALALALAIGLAVGLTPTLAPASAAPVVVASPTVSGTPHFRRVLRVTDPTWAEPPVGVTRRWLRDGRPIPRADAPRYQLRRADIGHRIAVRVTAVDAAGKKTRSTSSAVRVRRAVLRPRQAPQVRGVQRFGRTLRATSGRWSVTPKRVRYQWLRSGKPIPGAARATYRLRSEDVGTRIRVRVTARAPGYRPRSVASVRTPQVRHRVDVRRTVTYHVETRGRITTGLGTFRRQAQQTFDDPRGWRGMGVRFQRVARGGQFSLVLSEAGWVPRFSSGCSSTWSCRVGRYVIINQERWKHASSGWNAAGGGLRGYRHMVINHETGHWLGRGHASCPGPGKLAPVMMQQSKGLSGCRFNPWPTLGELGR